MRAGIVSHRTWLTPRELDIIPLVARGLTDAQVAERLGIKPRSVAVYLADLSKAADIAGGVRHFLKEHGAL